MTHRLVALLALAPFVTLATSQAAEPALVDRAAFMAAQDVLWRKAPTDLYNSPLLGNGLLGAYLHQGGAMWISPK